MNKFGASRLGGSREFGGTGDEEGDDIGRRGRKKYKPRKSEAETAAQADSQAVVPVEPEILEPASTPLPKDFLINKEAAARPQSHSFDEVDAEKLIKVMSFSDKMEEQSKAAQPEVVKPPNKEKNIELWKKPSLRDQVTKEQAETVEKFIAKEKDRPFSCLDEMLKILSAKNDPNVFINEQELRFALEKAKSWLVGSKKIYQALGYDTPEAQVRKIYKKMSSEGQHDFLSDYEPIRKTHQEVLEGMKNRLAGVRSGLMKKFPGGLVVRGSTKNMASREEFSTNLDSNASLFLFNKILGFNGQNAGEEEKKYLKKYLEKTNYIDYDKQPVKGGIHLDISPRLQGAWMKGDELYFDHHGGSSPRKSSAAEIIYQSFAKGHLLDHLNNHEKVALDRLIQFTVALDSYTLPTYPRAKINWRTVWEGSDKTLFGAALFLQNDLPIEDLFNFFKEHDLEEAIVKPLDNLKDPSLTRINQLRKDKEVGKGKEVIDNFFQILGGPRAPKAKVVDSRLGRIVVMVNESPKDKLPPGFQAAALAQGFDGILTFEPGSHAWFLAVGSQQKITKELADNIGEGEWVRESMIKKGRSKAEGISLGDLLAKLGVDLSNLEVYEGALSKVINRDKEMVTKIKPVLTPESTKTSEITTADVPVPATSETPTKPLISAETIDASKQPQIELENPKFKVGDLVKLKNGSKLTGNFFGKSRIIGGEWVSGVNFYEIEGVSKRKFPEEEIELVVEATPAENVRSPVEETSPAVTPPPVASIEISTPTTETAAEIINVDVAENALVDARREYIETYQDFLRFKGKPSLISRLRKGVRGLFKGGEAATMAELGADASQEIAAAREKYLQAKVEYAKAKYQEKARSLAQEGKSLEEIAEALKQFGRSEIFEKLVIGEEIALQAACSADWPPMEKGLLRRGFDAWVKMPLPARLLITTSVLTGALFAGGAIGVSAVAATASIRFARGLAGAFFGQGVSKAVGSFLSKRIAKETDARTEEARGEAGVALAEQNFDALNQLTEKYHKIFEDKVKKEKRKLLAQTVAAIGAGAGASLGLGWFAEATLGPGAGVQPEKIPERVQAPAVAEGKGFEQIIADMKARGQNLIDELTKQAREVAESARLEHVNELALLQKGEGIIHVLGRQLEDDPTRFGYVGNLENTQAVHEWARHLAGQISIKEGYWDPSQHAQKWFVYDSAKPMRFVLTGDAEKGFHIDQSGAARSFIHTGDAKVLSQQETTASAAPRVAEESTVGVRQELENVPVSQMPSVSHAGMRQVFSIGEGTEYVQSIIAPVDYDSQNVEWAANHAHLLQEKLNAAQDLAASYGANTIFAPAAQQMVERVQRDIEQFSNQVMHGHSMEGYDQLAPGQSWETYHNAVKQELDNQIWQDAFRSIGNTNLSTSARLDALKDMIPSGQELALNDVKYHLFGNEVMARAGEWEGKVDSKNIDWFSKFHQSFGTTAGVSQAKMTVLAEQLQKIKSA